MRYSIPEVTPVDDKEYQLPLRFTGSIDKLTLKVNKPMLTTEDIKKMENVEAIKA